MKKAQIWVETVIYTLIGLSILGIVLGVVKPSIDEQRDSLSIKQNVELMDYIDRQISEISYVGGNSRVLDMKIGRGKLIVDGDDDVLTMRVEDSKSEYSEPGVLVDAAGNVKALTEKKGGIYSVSLILNYTGRFNITYKGEDSEHTFQYAPNPYKVNVANNGIIEDLTNIDFF